MDLLADCKVQVDKAESDVEYEEIREMGIWHSTPLPGRHKSKISLTWVLKDLDNAKTPKDASSVGNKNQLNNEDVSRYQRHNQKFNENERQRKCKRSACKDHERVVGRNEYYNNYKYSVKSACEDPYVGGQETCSEDTSVSAVDYGRRRQRHKHRRRKSRASSRSGNFGYDIRDLDYFLSEVSCYF